jgi:anti-anti-sigma factor
MSGGVAGSRVVSSATPDDAPFTVVVRRRGHTPVLTLAGEVDLVTVDLVRDALAVASTAGVDVVVDLAAVRFAGACLGPALVAARRRQEARGGTLTLVNIPPAVWRLLHAAEFAAELGIGIAPARHGLAPTRPGPGRAPLGAAAGRPECGRGSGRCAAHPGQTPPRSPRTSPSR